MSAALGAGKPSATNVSAVASDTVEETTEVVEEEEEEEEDQGFGGLGDLFG